MVPSLCRLASTPPQTNLATRGVGFRWLMGNYIMDCSNPPHQMLVLLDDTRCNSYLLQVQPTTSRNAKARFWLSRSLSTNFPTECHSIVTSLKIVWSPTKKKNYLIQSQWKFHPSATNIRAFTEKLDSIALRAVAFQTNQHAVLRHACASKPNKKPKTSTWYARTCKHISTYIHI